MAQIYDFFLRIMCFNPENTHYLIECAITGVIMLSSKMRKKGLTVQAASPFNERVEDCSEINSATSLSLVASVVPSVTRLGVDLQHRTLCRHLERTRIDSVVLSQSEEIGVIQPC